MSTNLPDLYSRVCAKSPELAVTYLDVRPEIACFVSGKETPSMWRLIHGWHDDGEWRFETHELGTTWHSLDYPESHAAAMILARWLEALPVGVMLRRRINNARHVWTVQGFPSSSDCFDGTTPIEALAAFYLGQESA